MSFCIVSCAVDELLSSPVGEFLRCAVVEFLCCNWRHANELGYMREAASINFLIQRFSLHYMIIIILHFPYSQSRFEYTFSIHWVTVWPGRIPVNSLLVTLLHRVTA